MSVIWREDALGDIARISGYIAADHRAAARQISRELVLVGDSLTMFPRRGRLGRIPGTASLPPSGPTLLFTKWPRTTPSSSSGFGMGRKAGSTPILALMNCSEFPIN